MNTKRIKDDFRLQMEAVKIRRNWTDEEIAKRLGCSTRTLSNMRDDPFSVRGQYILVIQALAKEAERE